MSYPSLADMVICQHYWWDERTRQGVNASVQFTPKTIGSSGSITPNLTDAAEKAWIKTRAWKVTPDPMTGYLAVPLTPNDDPDLTAFGGYEVAPDGETARTVAIPSTAGTTTVTTQMAAALAKLSPPIAVTVGATVKTVWLTDVATISNPPSPPDSFFTADQTQAAVAAGILAHDDDTSAHPDIRALIGSGGGGSAPDATTSTKGIATLLGGTAANPTVPYSALTGTPSSLPPSGGAGGVLGGNYPNPSFAVDMATQAELDAVSASIPEVARDALGAALVAGANITITPDDAADTITITATSSGGGSYTDEQAQDAIAALFAAGTHSGISFTYNDAGNAISATVAAPSWSQVTGKPTFATVATSGSYADLSGRPDLVPTTQFTSGSHTPATGEMARYAPTSNISVALPAAATSQRFGVANVLTSSSTFTATFTCAGADTFSDGSTSIVLKPGERAVLIGASGGFTLESRTVIGAGALSVRSVSSNTTAVVGELLKVDASGGARTITPPSSPAAGAAVVLVKTDSTSNAVTFSATVDGDAQGVSLTAQWVAATLVFDGAAWLLESTTVSPTQSVASVNGRTGAVTGLAEATNVPPNTRQVTAGTGLTGGGDLSVDRTFAVSYGTSSTTAAVGNDSRITGAAQKTSNLSDLTDTAAARINLGANPKLTPTAKTGAYTATAGDLVLADASTAAFTVTLPVAASGSAVEVKKVDASTNVVTVAANSGNTVGSAAAASIPLRLTDQSATFQANGTNWVVHSGYQALSSLDGRYTGLSVNGSFVSTYNVDTTPVTYTDVGAAPLNLSTTTTGTSYTLVLTDNGKAVEYTGATAGTITVPTNASVALPVGAMIEVLQYGAGQVTIAPAAGVTLRTASTLTTRAQYSVLSLRQRAANEWVVAGDAT